MHQAQSPAPQPAGLLFSRRDLFTRDDPAMVDAGRHCTREQPQVELSITVAEALGLSGRSCGRWTPALAAAAAAGRLTVEHHRG